MRFPGEMPSVKDGKEWVRVSRTLFKSQWRALLDGAELRELIQYRPSVLLPAITMTVPTADGSHTGLSHAAEKTREAENAKITESNTNKLAHIALAHAEIKNECWLAIEMSMYDVAPIRMTALKSAHALVPPHPTSWSDGIAAFRELEADLVANAVAAPGEAICHDDELHRLRAQPIHDGCTVDEFSYRVNNALVKTIPFLDRPFSNATAISKWVISQLPAALAPDGRSLRRGLTAAQFADTKHVVAECITLVQQANEERQASLRTEGINMAGEAGRRPGGLGRGRGRGRGGDAGGGGGGSAGRGRGRSGGRGGGTETHYADGTLRPTSCSVAPPRGPMCDRKHTGACWRDPTCDVALPSRLKPALVKSIDEDRLANARRLGESIKTRQQPASGGVVGVMTESDMEQAWECENIYVFDDADADAALQTPATTDRKCLACYYDPCVCIAGGIPGTNARSSKNYMAHDMGHV